MMEHYDIHEDPNRDGNIKYVAKVKWDDNIKSELEFITMKNYKGLPYKEYIVAKCGCCGTDYCFLPSDLLSIIEKGYCSWCMMYKNKLVDYIYGYRSPTYDELMDKLNKAEGTFTPKEVRILLKGKK
jgi:hypothetical protein